MIWKTILLLGLFAFVSNTLAQPAKSTDPLHEFKRRAATFNSVITLPHFETTTNEVRVSVKQTIAAGNAALDRVGAVKPRQVTFPNTVRTLDDIGYPIGVTANRLSVLKETSTNAGVRDVATDALKELQE
jgi:Zn-dependent oligopeptidase